jgi:hypothetical protein
MKFRDVFVSESDRYALGVEENSGRRYLSIPVSNQMVDYEEYYKINRRTFEQFLAHPELAIKFANKCRNRKMDHLLFVKPGRDRGTAS